VGISDRSVISSSDGTVVVVVLEGVVLAGVVTVSAVIVVVDRIVVVGNSVSDAAGDVDVDASSLPPHAMRASANVMLSNVSGLRITMTTLEVTPFALTSRCTRSHSSDIRTRAQTLRWKRFHEILATG
jgi:hypothetical protein